MGSVGGPAAAGAKLGRYQVIKHLASGGMAEVLLARATGIEGFTRHVVIKRIRPTQAADPAFVTMFLNEARLAAQLHHHNIVQVHDIGQEGNEYFFAMEYVHGEDLRRLLTHLARHKEFLPLEHVVTIISAAAVALHHAHIQVGPDRKPLNIVHRDVTPANILVGYDGHVKVVDFGIAKAAIKTTEVTQAGALKGKASYMSPEQCTGSSPADRRSDVFALGVVAYELATTRRLFKGENDFLTMSTIVSGKIPPPTTHRPDMPAQLEAIILKALALKPEDRYQTADEMREALDQFAIEARLRTTTTSLAAYMKLQFGQKPEPWLVDAEEVVLSIDFDGSNSGLAPAPQQSIDSLDLPEAVNVASEAPIVRARSRAISQSPPLKKLPAVVPAKPARTPTRQIPALDAVPTAPSPATDKSRPMRAPVPAAPAPLPNRKRTITVQIPAQNQAAGAGVPPRTITMDASSGVPLPGMAPISDSSATAVTAIPKDVDSSWDPSRPVKMPTGAVPVVAPPAAVAAPQNDVLGAAPKSAAPIAGVGAPGAVAAPMMSAAQNATLRHVAGAPVAAPAATTKPASSSTPGSSTPATPAAVPIAATAAKTPAAAAASSSSASNPSSSASSSPASASSSGSWSPTKLLRGNDSSSRIPGEKAGLPSSKPMANGSSSRIPGLDDKPVDAKSNGSPKAAASLFSTNVAPAEAAAQIAEEPAPPASTNGATAAAAIDQADAVADAAAQTAEPAAKPARESAPALPPPPAVQVIPLSALAEAAGEKIGPARPLPGVAPIESTSPARDFATPIPSGDPTPIPASPAYPRAAGLVPAMERNDASAARVAAIAPATYPTAAANPWGSEASSDKQGLAKLLASKRNLAIAGGAALLLVIVLVMALSGGKKTPVAKTDADKAAHSKSAKPDTTKPDKATPDKTKPDKAANPDESAGDEAANPGAKPDETASGDETASDGTSGDETSGDETATAKRPSTAGTPDKHVAAATDPATTTKTTKTTAKTSETTTAKTTTAKTSETTTAKTTTAKTSETTTAKTTTAPTTKTTTAKTATSPTSKTTTAKTSETTTAKTTTAKTSETTTAKTTSSPTTKTTTSKTSTSPTTTAKTTTSPATKTSKTTTSPTSKTTTSPATKTAKTTTSPTTTAKTSSTTKGTSKTTTSPATKSTKTTATTKSTSKTTTSPATKTTTKTSPTTKSSKTSNGSKWDPNALFPK